MAAVCLLAAVCAVNAQEPDGSRPNILVILGDDMGIETLASFGVGTQTPRTATLDALAERSVHQHVVPGDVFADPGDDSHRPVWLSYRRGWSHR